MIKDDAIWMTGVGLATPIGHDLDAVESAMLAGRSGIGPVSSFRIDDYPSRIAGQVLDVPCPTILEPTTFRRLPRLEQVATWCVESALRDAGLWGRHRELRIGLVLGIGAEWMQLWEDDHRAGGDRVRTPARDQETTLDRVAHRFGLTGPILNLSAACASSNFAIEIGRNWLRRGLADACLAGGCEMAVTPVGLATFGNLKALSRRNDDPASASRPFDRSRDGFVLGEGGGVFVLERSGDACRRSARVYAEVAGCGSSSDAHHPVIPSPDPASAGRAVSRALADAGLRPDQVDHINAHATGTPVGDAAEAAVLRLVFGGDLDRIPVTSTKSMTGHLLTAAGAVEAVACMAAMRRRAIPPTINLEEIDVPLDVVAKVPREHPVEIAVSNSFGFGGSNSCLVLKAVEEPIG